MRRPAPKAARGALALRLASLALACCLAGALDPIGALAAELRIIAPSAPGSGWDSLAQALKSVLSDERGEAAVTVTNVPGSGGTVGLAKFLADASDDALLVTGLTMVGATAVHRSPVGLEQLTPIARLSAEAFVVTTPASSPLASMAELAAAIRADPAKVTWAGGPLGSIDHMATLLLARTLDAPLDRIGYGAFLTSHDAVAAVAEGQVSAAFVPYGEVAAELKSGRVRILAVSATERTAGLDAPTLWESGVPLELANWRGILARPGLDRTRRDRLVAQIETVAASRTWREMLDKRGWQSAFLPGDAFGEFIRWEQVRVKGALKAAGLLKRTPD